MFPPATDDAPRSSFLVLALLAAASLVPFLSTREIWDRAEARPPLVGADILETGRVCPPYLQGEPYLNKPPLFHALVAASFGLTRSRELWAARLPSVAAAIATVLVTAALGTALAGRRSGFLAGVLLLASFSFFEQARSSELEVLLTLCTSAMALALVRAAQAPERRARWMLAAFAAAAAGALTKGQMALVPPALFALASCLAARSVRPLRNPVYLAILAGALAAIAAYYGPLLLDEHWRSALFQRLGFENVRHERAWFYYLWALPACLLPAGLVLPLIARRWRTLEAPVRALAIGAALGVVVFSISASKQSHYLLPFFPWIAVAGGAALRASPWPARRWLAAAAGAIAVLLAVHVVRSHTGNAEKSEADAMRAIRAVAGTAPLASLEREPDLWWYLRRPDLVPLADAAGGIAFLAAHPDGLLLVERDGDAALAAEYAALPLAAEWRSPSGRHGWALLAAPGAPAPRPNR